MILSINVNDTYESPSEQIVVNVDEQRDVARIWCNVESPGETFQIKAEHAEWLQSIFNLYGWDFNDSRFQSWEKGRNPMNGRTGIVDTIVF